MDAEVVVNLEDVDPELQPTAHRVGQLPTAGVPGPVQSAHLTQMASMSPAAGRWGHKLRVGAAFLAGLLIGGSGLAAAGALPGPLQATAHDALAQVGIEVPDHDSGPKERSTEGCDGEYDNHGAFVSAQAKARNEARVAGEPADGPDGGNSEAASSECGKPVPRTVDAESEGPGKADKAHRPDDAEKSSCRPGGGTGMPTPDAATADRPDGCDDEESPDVD